MWDLPADSMASVGMVVEVLRGLYGYLTRSAALRAALIWRHWMGSGKVDLDETVSRLMMEHAVGQRIELAMVKNYEEADTERPS